MTADRLAAAQKKIVAKRFDEALRDLGPLLEEEGHNFRDLGRADDALVSYARACRFNPALDASWRGQLAILTNKGLDVQARQVKLFRQDNCGGNNRSGQRASPGFVNPGHVLEQVA